VSVYIPKLPEEAPFSAPQRAWLNGYFAGMMGGDTGTAAAASAPIAEEDFPWHDPAYGLDERLALAKDRALPRRLMAAMAQLDCGQCGYLCQSYGEALASGAEKSLGKCVPGGKETSKALRALMAEAPAAAAPAIKAEAAHPPGRLIAEAVFKAAMPLNGEGSAKDTRHVVFDLSGTGLEYRPGDAFGLYAPIDPALAASVVATLGADPAQMVERDGRNLTLGEMLSTVLDIARPGDSVVETMMKHAAAEDRDGLAKILDGAADAPLADPDLLDLLLKFPAVRPPLDELLASLEELQPRLYSIASSPRAHEGEVHLTIGVVRYKRNDRARQGVASTFLAERHPPGAKLRCFVQPAHGFRLPEDMSKPVIMIGPGTGIAPFRAFLEERHATKAPGKNWLFFGDQHEACDFIYRDEIAAFRAGGTLTRLDLAFSRDGAKKVYVQDRMREAGAELWAWLNEGAHIYVCGDASRMARDVDAALREIVAAQGGMDEAATKAFVQKLAADKRYQRDVY
jgi:sulfite reductase (NADPH) flavoprotein alpha-component